MPRESPSRNLGRKSAHTGRRGQRAIQRSLPDALDADQARVNCLLGIDR